MPKQLSHPGDPLWSLLLRTLLLLNQGTAPVTYFLRDSNSKYNHTGSWGLNVWILRDTNYQSIIGCQLWHLLGIQLSGCSAVVVGVIDQANSLVSSYDMTKPTESFFFFLKKLLISYLTFCPQFSRGTLNSHRFSPETSFFFIFFSFIEVYNREFLMMC